MKIEPNSLSLFRMNSCSLNKILEDNEYLVKATNKTFDVIATRKSRTLKDSNLSKNITINNCTIEFTPTESHAGETLY